MREQHCIHCVVCCICMTHLKSARKRVCFRREGKPERVLPRRKGRFWVMSLARSVVDIHKSFVSTVCKYEMSKLSNFWNFKKCYEVWCEYELWMWNRYVLPYDIWYKTCTLTQGLPNNIDAAVTWTDTKMTYFFKGSNYWKFDNQEPASGESVCCTYLPNAQKPAWTPFIFSLWPMIPELRCRTDSGLDPGKKCTFPFTYLGTKYHACTMLDGDGVRSWCSTEVDAEGKYISGKWGFCEPDCVQTKQGWLPGCH